ncbi:DNA-methyltransferase [Spiroplasma clarkii]|uniref:Cytosine-specific methyltransferase n=1 Tax=Spiroplasma clarkii TaxID=2139 RepID=A0A1Y0L2G1_9MOLU|nr:DNA (cytosine-5-)-methyltransferase [Spiroplasma clarkii]ARU91905.1 DNA-methyltransferase [Spiroplasma clarkii]ATX71251.1 DNA (cytosine-5)-methyltransferase 1 [Spiroplasma clarkii]
MKKKIVETFAGIGSQAKALERLKKDFPKFDYEITHTCEWFVDAIIGYAAIHNNLKSPEYLKYYNEDIKKITLELKRLNISQNSKEPLRAIGSLSEERQRRVYASIKVNKNLVDITTVSGTSFADNNIDLLTYSFPCQDLSIAGKGKGMAVDSNTRSSLLWHIERILSELHEQKNLPQYLLMENVSAITHKKHKESLEFFKSSLNNLGYTNLEFILDAADFGIPQSRKRYFLISKLNDPSFNLNFNDLNIKSAPFAKYIDLKAMTPTNRHELYVAAIKAQIDREKITEPLKVKYKNLNVYPTFNQANIVTGLDCHNIATITFSGENSRQRILTIKRGKFRVLNLGAKENLLLMGFDKRDYAKMLKQEITTEKIRSLAGNSIVVDVLYNIFKKIFT